MIKDNLKDKDCFIIGSGPSLNGFDFRRLDNVFTIGVNHVIEHYDNLDCLLFSDRIFAKTTTYNLSKFNGLIFANETTTGQPNVAKVMYKENFHEFHGNRTQISTDLETQGLYHPTNSGILAMNLALIMNAKKIYLLGYDYYYENGKMHFFNNKPHHDRYPEVKFKKKLERMWQFEKYKNRFVNLNPASNLTIFPFGNVDKVLA